MNELIGHPITKKLFVSLSSSLLGIGALSAMLVATIAVVIWGLDRGLGLGDEGVYLLSARHPEDIRQNVSAVYLYTGFIFKFVGYNPQLFRLAGVVLLALSSLIFWFGLDRLLSSIFDRSRVELYRWHSLSFMLIGALLYYQWFFPTPNNYTLNAIALNSFAGTLLLGLASLKDGNAFSRSAAVSFLVSGIALGVAIFTKIPSGFCLLLVACFIIAFWKCRATARIKTFVSFFAGVALWFLLHFCFVLGPSESWLMFIDGWVLFQAFGVHVPGIKIFLYLNEIFLLFYSAFLFFWPANILILVALGVKTVCVQGKFYKAGYDTAVVAIAFLIAMSLTAMHALGGINQPEFDGGIPGYILYAFAWVLLLVLVGLHLAPTKWDWRALLVSSVDRNVIIIVLALIAMPVAAAIGTANPIYNVVAFYSVPWFGAILLLLVSSEKRMPGNTTWFAQACMLVIGAFSTAQIIKGYVYMPQQISANMRLQNFETTVGFPEMSLKLDIQTSELINNLAAIAKENGFKKGDDIIAISYLPSLVYALGGRSPGHPAFLVGSESSLNYSRMALQFADMDRLKASMVLINTEETEAASILTSRGLDFPADYKNIGTVEHIDVYGRQDSFSLWKPN